jgi:hypothetical protein
VSKESTKPVCGLNTFTRGVQKAAKSFRVGSWLGVGCFGFRASKRPLVFSLQWRDRAGFSPASLFFPLLGGKLVGFLLERSWQHLLPNYGAELTMRACGTQVSQDSGERFAGERPSMTKWNWRLIRTKRNYTVAV